MQGKIIKGIAGFYYVHDGYCEIYECKAKGVFRNKKIKPLVGDNVEIDILDEKEHLGNIISILPRQNFLIRPSVANVDQAVVLFAAKEPEPNLDLLDRFLITMEQRQIPSIICFNKSELTDKKQLDYLREIYHAAGYPLHIISIHEESGLCELKTVLKGKTTVLAGPSGVGKSSLMNWLNPEAEMETGRVSEKIKRGRHTTRHSELFYIGNESYVLDTPGFSSIYLEGIEADELRYCFPEFDDYEGKCRFLGCIHDREPDCAVKQATEKGVISRKRYDSYIALQHELKEKRKY